MGFSPLGFIVAIAVLAPNLSMLRFSPRPPLPRVHLPRPLGWLERVGQALCLVVPAITEPGATVWGWAIAALAALAAYYALWGRYLAGGRSAAALYQRLWVLPVPMAVLPVAVFLATAAWLSNGWIALAAVILAAGHIPAAVIMGREVAGPR